jgi:uncharacterized membrane protein
LAERKSDSKFVALRSRYEKSLFNRKRDDPGDRNEGFREHCSRMQYLVIAFLYKILLFLSCASSSPVFIAGRVRLPKDLKVVIGRRRK